MVCKHLKSEAPKVDQEVSGPITPQIIFYNQCDLGWIIDQNNLKTICAKTPMEGPCWWWEKYHEGERDSKF